MEGREYVHAECFLTLFTLQSARLFYQARQEVQQEGQGFHSFFDFIMFHDLSSHLASIFLSLQQELNNTKASWMEWIKTGGLWQDSFFAGQSLLLVSIT